MAPEAPSSLPPASKRLKTSQSSLTTFFERIPASAEAPNEGEKTNSCNKDVAAAAGAPTAVNVAESAPTETQGDVTVPQGNDIAMNVSVEAPGASGKSEGDGVAGSSSSRIGVEAAQGDEQGGNDNDNNNESENFDPIFPQLVSHSPHASWSVYQNTCIYRKLISTKNDDAYAPRSKIAGIDLDGTLVEWLSKFPSALNGHELWNAGVVNKLREYHDSGYKLVIFSNQGGIMGAFSGVRATCKKNVVEWLAHVVDRPIWAVFSTKSMKKSKDSFHKPSTKMWTLAEKFLNAGQPFDLASSFYCGDSAGGEGDDQGAVDLDFAKNVGELKGGTLKFYTPQELFGPSNQALRKEQKQQTLCLQVPPPHVLQTRAALTSGYLQGPIMLILCGAQGSGKSTFCEQILHDNADRWVHLSQDTIRNGKPGKREAVEEAAKHALVDDKKSVVIDRMHLNQEQRKYFVDAAKSVGIPVHAVVLSPPKELVAQRVRERENHPTGFQGEKYAKVAVGSVDNLVMPNYDEDLDLISVAYSTEGALEIVELYRRVSSVGKAGGAAIPAAFQRSGVSVPAITLGTYRLGRKVAHDVVSLARTMGFKAFDTAPTYNNEDRVGGELNDDSFCIAKVPKRASTAAKARQELQETMTKLQRKQVDLLLLHWPAEVIAAESLKEVWQEMEKCVEEGLTRSIGVCNFNIQALSLLLPHCSIRPIVNQVERHPLLPQFDLVEFCAKHDILLQAHTPLGQADDDLLKHPVVKQVAARSGHSAAQVVLLWNLQQRVAVVPKCSSEEHMREVLATQSVCGLSPEDMKVLNELKEEKRFVTPPFMYGSEPFCWGTSSPST